MSGPPPSRNDGQDTSTLDAYTPEAQRQPAPPQHGFQPQPLMQHQVQYIQGDSSDSMRMSTLQNALPEVQNPIYASSHRYPVVNPAASYQPHPQGHHSAYQGYPQSPTHTGGIQYQYVDQSAHAMQYSPVQGQFTGQQMYAGQPQMQQYGVYPPGFGPPSPVHQRGFQGLHRGYSGPEYGQSGIGPIQSSTSGGGRVAHSQGGKPPSTNASVPAAPRGPPRKPKQSGYALWVGNLPPGTRVNDLKDHFAREATKDIESVFLISKSNCAFVNYRSEEACAAAMQRFHDSRFQGVRLVTRLRKTPSNPLPQGSGPSSGAPRGPSAQQQLASTQLQSAVEAIAQNRESSQKAADATRTTESPVVDKYFIVKSLTVEDLELSVRNGIWATQGHNEDALNKAFEVVEYVYLIFSANKSGEYFGYARMQSPINDEIAKTLDWKKDEAVSRPEVLHVDPELPRSIETPASEWAPRGRIIDDSARGTIFWEAESDNMEQEPRESPGSDEPEEFGQRDGEEEEVVDEAKDVAELTADEAEEASVQTFGRPFRVQWVSTNRLPFFRTRGMRNAWNANREVKIARDGTELETQVGRKLISLFQRPAIPPVQMQQAQQYMGHMQAPMGYMPPFGGRY